MPFKTKLKTKFQNALVTLEYIPFFYVNLEIALLWQFYLTFWWIYWFCWIVSFKMSVLVSLSPIKIFGRTFVCSKFNDSSSLMESFIGKWFFCLCNVSSYIQNIWSKAHIETFSTLSEQFHCVWSNLTFDWNVLNKFDIHNLTDLNVPF